MPIIIDIAAEGPAKRQIIEMAFSELGAAGYEFGREPEEIADALGRLNALMAEWKVMRGIDLGYEQPDYGTGNADNLSGIPFETLNTVASFLALRICPMMGAEMSGESRGNLTRSLLLLEAHYATVPTMHRDCTSQRGLGNRRWILGAPACDDDLEPVPAAP